MEGGIVGLRSKDIKKKVIDITKIKADPHSMVDTLGEKVTKNICINSSQPS